MRMIPKYDTDYKTEYKRECKTYYVQGCEKYYDTRYEDVCTTYIDKECDTYYDTTYDIEYGPKCEPAYRKECHGHGRHRKCDSVAIECRDKPFKGTSINDIQELYRVILVV